MKNYLNILSKCLIALLLFAGVSCQNLDESPAGISTSANFYTTPSQCEAAFAASMNDLINTWSGYENYFGFFPDGQHDWETLDLGADYGAELWKLHYSAIKNVNAVLKAVKGGSLEAYPNEVDGIVAQAKFLRAFNYFILVRLFGEIPFITEDTPDPVITPLTPESRVAVATMYDNLEADLTFAAENLPDLDPSAPGRPNLWTAKSLLAKVYLTRATAPLNQTNNYAKARDMADDVIVNGPYSLVTNIEDVFKTSNKNNSEMIFAFQSTEDDPRSPGQTYAPSEWDGWNSGPVLPAWAEAYPEQPRKHNYLLLDWHTDINDLSSPIIHYTDGSDQLPFMGKYNYPNLSVEEQVGNSLINIPLLRLADVLLMYAEAANMANGGPTQLAVDRLNMIIDRANAGTGLETRADIAMSSVDFDKKVIDERSYELCFEFDRIFDVYRKRLLEEVMPPEVLVDYNPEDYLFPIPAFDAEFIGQNEGYE
jgi:starch-binding outer membrane protein, SusD/RagB family